MCSPVRKQYTTVKKQGDQKRYPWSTTCQIPSNETSDTATYHNGDGPRVQGGHSSSQLLANPRQLVVLGLLIGLVVAHNVELAIA